MRRTVLQPSTFDSFSCTAGAGHPKSGSPGPRERPRTVGPWEEEATEATGPGRLLVLRKISEWRPRRRPWRAGLRS